MALGGGGGQGFYDRKEVRREEGGKDIWKENGKRSEVKLKTTKQIQTVVTETDIDLALETCDLLSQIIENSTRESDFEGELKRRSCCYFDRECKRVFEEVSTVSW